MSVLDKLTAYIETTSAPLPASSYEWFTYNGARAKNIPSTNGKRTAKLTKGTRFGLRDSSNGKTSRMITDEHGPTIVFTLDEPTLKTLKKNASPASKAKGGTPKSPTKPAPKGPTKKTTTAPGRPKATGPAPKKPVAPNADGIKIPTQQEFLKLMADTTGAKVTMNRTFKQQDLDELDVNEMVMMAEEEWNTEIPDRVADKLKSPLDLYSYLKTAIKSKGGTQAKPSPKDKAKSDKNAAELKDVKAKLAKLKAMKSVKEYIALEKRLAKLTA